MARVRKPKPVSYKPEAGADFGPALRPDQDGRLVHWKGAAAVVVESRDDPDVSDRRRLIRGARRCDTLDMLLSRRIITKRMRDAAERFLDDCSIAAGGSAGDAVPGMPRGPANRLGLPERQVLAITRINEVRHMLGLNSGTVFWHVVFVNGGLREFEEWQKCRNGTAAELLRNALEALDDYYHGSHPHRRRGGMAVADETKHHWPGNIRA